MNKPFKTKNQKIIYEGFFDFREDLLLDHKGNPHVYSCLVSKADGVIVLAELEKETFIFTHEYRYPIDQKVLSCPGGRVNPGEMPADGAKRELLEETGYLANSLTLLNAFYPFPSVSDQKVWIYLAKDLSLIQSPSLDPLEEISLKILSLSDLKKLDFNNYLLDGTLPTALFYRSLITS